MVVRKVDMEEVPDLSEGIEVVIVVTYLAKEHAAKFTRILRQATIDETDPVFKKSLRQMARRIVDKCNGDLHIHRRPVKRPLDDDEVALKRVIEGDAPYPVLSRSDARRALIALTGNLSVRVISERLHVDKGTIRRWQREYRSGHWREADGES